MQNNQLSRVVLKRLSFCLLLILIFTSIAGAKSTVKPDIFDTAHQIKTNLEEVSLKLDLAMQCYQTAGIEQQLQVRALLWTENQRRRNDLTKRLPTVDASLARQCQALLIQVLQLDGNNQTALIMAGDYHALYHQPSTAAWYYQRALGLDSESIRARLALADLYLENWQPREVLGLLESSPGSAVAFRKGEAYLQCGEYQLAEVCFLEATSLPRALQSVRDKDLLKMGLALGRAETYQNLLTEITPEQLILTTLERELRGWEAWLGGRSSKANVIWGSGKQLNPDYSYWQTNLTWLNLKEGAPNYSTPDSVDTDLNAALYLLYGQGHHRSQEYEAAYQSFTSAIKADRRSLVGFLEAGVVRASMDNYQKAIELYNQGLTINPNFSPLLLRRAEAYRRLGEAAKAETDRMAALRAKELAKQPARLSAVLQPLSSGKRSLWLKGEIRNLVGVWISTDARTWYFQPWWGGSVLIESSGQECWVVPVGRGVSGETIYLNLADFEGTDEVLPVKKD